MLHALHVYLNGFACVWLTRVQVLLVKALPVTGTLLVTLVREPCPTGITAQTLELPVDQYCSTSDKTTYSYNNLDQLISQVQTAMQTQVSQSAIA